MSTTKQITANQANSQKSTGPKTEAGKAASSQNACEHGLSGLFRVLSTERQDLYDNLLQRLFADYNPEDTTESILVENMAQHQWLRQRAIEFQNRHMEAGGDDDMRRLSLYMRYETMHARAYHKCLNDLLKIRAERQKQENGFASQEYTVKIQELELRCREADANYRESRAIGAQFENEYKLTYKMPPGMPGEREVFTPKAA